MQQRAPEEESCIGLYPRMPEHQKTYHLLVCQGFTRMRNDLQLLLLARAPSDLCLGTWALIL